MYEPRELYDRIVRVRRREGCDAEAACGIVYRELKFNLNPVLREAGMYMLRKVEQEYFSRYGFSGGHRIPDAQGRPAPAPLNGDDHASADTHDRRVAAEPSEREGGQGATDAHRLPATLPARPEDVDGQSTRDAHAARAVSVSSAGGDSGGQGSTDAQRSDAPGTPWPVRAAPRWDWRRETSLGGQRVPLGDSTWRDWSREARIDRLSAESFRDREKAASQVSEWIRESGAETFREAWERNPNGLISVALRKLKKEDLLGIEPPHDAASALG